MRFHKETLTSTKLSIGFAEAQKLIVRETSLLSTYRCGSFERNRAMTAVAAPADVAALVARLDEPLTPRTAGATTAELAACAAPGCQRGWPRAERGDSRWRSKCFFR